METTTKSTPSKYTERAARAIDGIILSPPQHLKGRRADLMLVLGELLEACEYVDYAAGDCDSQQGDDDVVEVRMTLAGIRQLRDAVSYAKALAD